MKTIHLVVPSLCLLGVTLPTEVKCDSRPNILFVFSDDWGRYASCYKGLDGRPTINDVVKTPNVDRVAKEGVLFRNAYVNAPSCTPCRSSLFSGRYFFNCNQGAILNGAVWDESIPVYPLMLKEAGYSIGKSFKVWSPGTPADAPFGGQKYAYEKAGRAPNNFSEEVTARVEKGMPLVLARKEVLDQVRQNFEEFLTARKKGNPWHYYFGPTTTHRTWIKGSGKKLWGIEPELLKGKMPKFLPDVPEVREDVGDYLGECQAVDAYVGVLLKCLEETGEAGNTVIVLSGDHGMPGVTSGKCNLYDMYPRRERAICPIQCVRCIPPTIIYIRNFEPDRWPMGSPGAVTPEFTPDSNELENNTRIAFADMDASPTKAWLVKNRLDPKWQWFYELAFAKRPGEELYDVHRDPDMIKNLAGNIEFAAVKKKLSDQLMKELTHARDPRVVENPPRFEQSPFTNP